MADLPVVAVMPISLAYSGSIAGPVGPVPLTATCHAARKATRMARETSGARSRVITA